MRRHFGTVLFHEGSYIFGSALVTVTNVKMSSDLGIAKIYLSIYNSENKLEVMQMMRKNMHPLRQALSQRLKKHVRRIPEIAIYMDETLDEMYKLNQIFDGLDETKREEE